MGASEPYATGTLPFQSDFGTPYTPMKGSFPAPPGSDPAFVEDDDGVDEVAVVAAMRATLQRINEAVADNFQADTRQALLAQLKALIQSTGATGMLPRSETNPETPIEGSALLMFDAILKILIEAGHSTEVGVDALASHEERLRAYKGYADSVYTASFSFRNGTI